MPLDPRRILFEDDQLLIVSKLDGELTVAAGGKGKLPLFDFLKKQYPSLRVVHRLDFGTSGVIVFAKTSEAVRRLRDSQDKWVKKYRTLAAGEIHPNKGTIERKLPARTNEAMVDATSHYTVLFATPLVSYVEVEIETGRKHQVRLHLKAIGHPLLLDPLYGNPDADRAFRKKFHYHRFFLHAYSLDLPHPMTKEVLHLVSPLTASFQKVLREIGYTE